MATEDARKLFVAGLPDTITEDVLRQLFEATGGTVVEVSIPRDRATGRPRGFGFVTLSTAEEAGAAREALDGSFQAGKSISVRPFQAEPPRREAGMSGPPRGMPSGPPPAAAAPDRTLYVGNLPYDCTQEEVEKLVSGTGAGNAVRVNLPLDPDGRKRGFGFVTMDSPDAAKAALEALRGADLRGRRLVINIAHPKGERGERGGRPDSAPGAQSRPGPAPSQRTSSQQPPPPDRPFRGGPGPSFGAGPPPDPPRRTFDERRKSHDHDGEGGARRRGRPGRERERHNDWTDYEDDDEK
jgi:RNA recognition motif-containing protein